MQCSYCFLVSYIFATLVSVLPMLVKVVSDSFLLKCNVYVIHLVYNIARSAKTADCIMSSFLQSHVGHLSMQVCAGKT